MFNKSKLLITFFLAFLVATPSVGLNMVQEADAGPLSSSRKSGKRTKKTKKRSRRSTTRSSSRRTSSQRSTRRGTTRRNVTRTRTVSRRRVDDRRVVHRTSRRYRPARRVRHVHHVRRPVRRTTTVVHHHHHDRGPAPAYRSSADAPRKSVRGKRVGTDFFVMGNVGLSGLASSEFSDEALPGTDFNLVIGGKGQLLGVDLGFNLAGYRFDTAGPANQADLAKVGMTLDVKLQPSLAIFEPYLLVGGGIYSLQDDIDDISSSGAGLRLGGGLGLRLGDSFGLTAGYLYETIGFSDEFSNNTFGAQTETVSVGAKIYF